MSNLELESITTFFLSLFTKIIVVDVVDVVDVVVVVVNGADVPASSTSSSNWKPLISVKSNQSFVYFSLFIFFDLDFGCFVFILFLPLLPLLPLLLLLLLLLLLMGEEASSSTSLFIFAFGCNQTICSSFVVVDDDGVDDARDVTPPPFIRHRPTRLPPAPSHPAIIAIGEF